MLYDKRWDQKVKSMQGWRQVLLNAASHIEMFGWTTGKFNSGGKHCALGAILRQEAPFLAKFRAVRALRRVIHKDGWHCGIMYWNDNFALGCGEVISFLRRAANR